MIRTLILLYRLVRELHMTTTGLERRAVEFRIIVEPASSFERRAKLSLQMGEDPPPRESMCEVSYWPVAGQPCHTQRGATLAVALKKAMDAPFPASLS